MQLSAILQASEQVLVGLAAFFTLLLTFSKKFRKWLNDRLRDTDEIHNINALITEINGKVDNLEDVCGDLSVSMQKLTEQLEQDKETTLLTTKYEILDICNRAKRFNGITETDKKLLCDLYHQYVDIWDQNHYVKSTADYVIKKLPVIDKYER